MVDAKAINVALGKAIRRLQHAAGINQTELAERIGGEGVDQTTISRWERGLDNIPAYRILQIENALRLPRGALWADAGLVDLTSVEQAIYADTNLTATEKRSLAGSYNALSRGQTGGSGSRKS